MLDDLENEERLWSDMQGNIRREIRKAEKQVEICDDLGIETFIDLNFSTFARQGMHMPCSREFIRRIDAMLQERGQRRIFFAVDAHGRVHAALYLIWDSTSAFYLMGGADAALRTSGSSSLLMWEAIRFASSAAKRFDFEGSIVEPIERFFRGFGAKQQQYFTLISMNRRMRLFSLCEGVMQRIFSSMNTRGQT